MPRTLPHFIPIAIVMVAMFAGCEREIVIELPDSPTELVIEGTIETGVQPLVWVGLTQGYFDPLDLAEPSGLFLGDAELVLHATGESVTLDAFCTGDLTGEALDAAADLFGLSPEAISAQDLCIYTTFNPDWQGAPETTYRLEVSRDGQTATAITTIPGRVPLDSVWSESPGPPDSLVIAHALVTDPDTLGNAYRWFARRLNVRPDWDPEAGEVKDADFVAPLGSVIDDAFFNGLTFEFTAFRGSAVGSDAWDDQFENGEVGFFKHGDTVVVKACAMDHDVYLALASYEAAILGQGSPFTVPADMASNVEGARGIFAGYATSFDTVICAP